MLGGLIAITSVVTACLGLGSASAPISTAPVQASASLEPAPLAALFLEPAGEAQPAGQLLWIGLIRGGLGLDEHRQAVAPETVQAGWIYVRQRGTQENRDSADGFMPAPPPLPELVAAGNLPVPVAPAGVAMIGMEIARRTEAVTLEQWHTFAAAELDRSAWDAIRSTLPAEGLVRIRLIESAKLIVRLGDHPGEVVDEQTASSKAGQAAEIRLLMDATSLPRGADVPVRGYADYSSRAAIRFRAAPDHMNVVQSFTGDQYGIGAVHLAAHDRWRIVARHAQPAPVGDDAHIILHTATLVFDIPEAEARR